MFRLCAWNAEKDWMGTLAGTDGFKRGEGSRGSGEGFRFRDKGRSIVAHDLDSV